MTLFQSSRPLINVRVLPRFPAAVLSGAGIEITPSNGNYTIDLDYADLVENTSLGTPSGYYLAILDTTLPTPVYEKVRLDNVIAGATGIDSRRAVGDTDFSVTITDRYIGLTEALTAVRTITLPAAATVPPGRLVTVQDEVGGLSGAFYWVFIPTGADTISGAAILNLKSKRGAVTLRSNGTNAWNAVSTPERTVVNNANYTAVQGDSVIAYTAIAAARVVTLPAASALAAGQRLTIVDESGSCSGTNTISIARAGADTINGAVTSAVIVSAFGYLELESDGVSRWTIIDRSGTFPQRTAVNNVNYTASPSDAYIGYTALTATRTITLPAASACAPGQYLAISDESGSCSSTNKINVACAGADTFFGVASGSIDTPYGSYTFISNGVNKWALVDFPIHAGNIVDASALGQTLLMNTTAAQDRTSLGAAASGANTDITSLTGRTNGAGAGIGQIGEVISNIATGISQPTTGVPVNVTSIVLTPGDWDVMGSNNFVPAGTTTVVRLVASLSLTSGVSGASNSGAYIQIGDANLTTGALQVCPVGMLQVNVSVPTTVFLVANASFGVSTMTHSGFIRARRMS